MLPENPTIGIALAAYRPDLAFFIEQLQSIRNQSYPNWVCLIGFDSPLAEYTSEPSLQTFLNDSRFLFLENSRRLGHPKNFENTANTLLNQYSHLEFIAFSDQDDHWYPEKLEVGLNAIKTTPLGIAFHSDMHLWDGSSLIPSRSVWQYENRITQNISIEDLFIRNICTGGSMIIHSSVVKKYLTIPSVFGNHDHWYALMAMKEGVLVASPKLLYAYRQHQSNLIGASRKTNVFQLRKRWSIVAILRHFKVEYLAYVERANSLPTTFPDVKKLSSYSALSRIFLKNYQKNPMLARNALMYLLGKIISTLT